MQTDALHLWLLESTCKKKHVFTTTVYETKGNNAARLRNASQHAAWYRKLDTGKCAKQKNSAIANVKCKV